MPSSEDTIDIQLQTVRSAKIVNCFISDNQISESGIFTIIMYHLELTPKSYELMFKYVDVEPNNTSCVGFALYS
jgi:hypothetical protein